MTNEEIKSWLNYWQASKMVAVEQIQAFDQVYQARKYCECMRVGVFHPKFVSDLQIWLVIRRMRKPDQTKDRGPGVILTRPIDSP